MADRNGVVLAKSQSFGRDLLYLESVSYYQSGQTQAVVHVYGTQETVSGTLDSVAKVIGQVTRGINPL